MATMILVVVFGIIFSYFATINTGLVDINFGQSTISSLPLYAVILFSISLGVLISFLIHIIQLMGSNWNINSKEKNLDDARREIAELTKKNHKLEIDNTKLRSKLGEEDFDDDSI